MKPTYRRSWAGNLLMFSDLTLGPSFKVKRWFTGFGELSFWWIQICIGSPMRRSSLGYISKKPEVIDTSYPWYECTVVYVTGNLCNAWLQRLPVTYTSKIYPALFIPLYD